MIGLSPISLGSVSNFIVNYIGKGIGQLLIYYIGLALLILGVYDVLSSFEKLSCVQMQMAIIITGIVFIIASFAWQITEGVLIILCRIPDGNGYGFY